MDDRISGPRQFSLKQLVVVLTVYSLVLAMVAALPLAAIGAALLSTTVFVAIDLVWRIDAKPRWVRVTTTIAHYATAYVYSMAACGVVYVWLIDADSPKPAPGTTSTFTLSDALSECLTIVVVAAYYWMVSTFFSLVGAVAAFTTCRQTRRSTFLLFANAPWLALIGYVIIQQCFAGT
jgi:hypothetical protein